MPALIDDTYAEAFRSLYAEILITARDKTWLDYALNACTGNASSTILCDCEAGATRDWMRALRREDPSPCERRRDGRL